MAIVVIQILATFRLASLLASPLEYGVYDIFHKLRVFLGRKASGGNVHWEMLADLFSCPYCMGVWLAPLIYFLDPYGSTLIEHGLFILAIAGGQALLQGVTDGYRTATN